MWKERMRGYYAVLDRDDRQLAEALLGAAGVIQLRIKTLPTSQLLPIARWLRQLTRARSALMVVNDHLDLAIESEADFVHLGQDDMAIAEARERIAEARLPLGIGISTHTDEQVSHAVADGADYLGFGPVFVTGTKVKPDPVVGLDGLRSAVALAGEIPVVAIGGISVERAPEVFATGAHAACAIASVNQAADPAAAARSIAAAWSP